MSVTCECSVGVGVGAEVGIGVLVSVGAEVGIRVLVDVGAGRVFRGGVRVGNVYAGVGGTVAVGVGKHSPVDGGGGLTATTTHMRRPRTTPPMALKIPGKKSFALEDENSNSINFLKTKNFRFNSFPISGS